MTSGDKNVKRAICAKCRGERNCYVRGYHRNVEKIESASFQSDWFVLECCGCEHVFFQKISTDLDDVAKISNDSGIIEDETEEEISYWPPIPRREAPEWFTELIEIKELDSIKIPLFELYSSVNSGMTIMPSIGIRTCFDISSILLGVDEGISFAKKLKQLEANGALTREDCQRVETLIDAGSAAAHRGWNPRFEQLGTLIEILEHFLFQQFVEPARKARLDEKAKELKAEVPARANEKSP
jgi:hypothetical protein